MLKLQISELTTVNPENASHVGFSYWRRTDYVWKCAKKIFVSISGVLLRFAQYWNCRELSTVMEGL